MALFVALIALFDPSFALGATGATIITDKPDYAPGETVWITGSGFASLESVTVQIEHLDTTVTGGEGHNPWTVKASTAGGFTTSWVVPFDDNVGESLKVTATGNSSGLAATVLFTDVNTILTITSIIADSLCPGDTLEVCANLVQHCASGSNLPLEGREILFFINPGNCGVEVGQNANDSDRTDVAGNACGTIIIPITPGNYTIRAKFRGEEKPSICPNPGNSACDPNDPNSNKRCVELSNSNECRSVVVDSAACCTPPVITCPANIVKNTDAGQCAAAASFSATATGTCGPVSIVCTPPSGSSFPKGITTVTCIATNSVGQKDTCQFTVTVNDNIPPTVTCPADIAINTAPGECAADVSYTASATDNCPGVVMVCLPPSGASFPKGVTTVTCIATDTGGKKDTCRFTVTVNDNEPPSANCPANIMVNNTAGQCAANVNYSATATDNCPGASISCIPPSGSSFPVGATTVTCIAIDASGKKDTCQFTVTVNDNQPPVASCPADITVNANGGGNCTAVVNYTANVSDNCAGATISCAPPSGSTFPAGTTTVTCIAMDAAGKKDTCQFNVNVVDNTPPVVACPANISVNTAPGQCAANVSYTANATDNCPGVGVVCTPLSGSSFPKGTTTVTCIATDAGGKKDTCQFTVTVNDTEPPVAQCPSDFFIDSDPGQCGAVVNYDANATDNCLGVTIACNPPSGSTFPVGATIVTCIATDASGNKDTCQFIIRVADVEPPVAQCPADITVNANGGGNCTAMVNYTANVSDNCAGETIACIPPSGSTFPAGTTVVTCIATDGAGNRDTCQFNINVVDSTPPEVTCPANITTSAAPGRCDTAIFFNVTPTDNCPGATVACVPPSGTLFHVGVTTITCIASDASGNKDTCQFTITVNDTQPPTVSCPANISVNAVSGQCAASVSYNASAMDNCGPPITPAVSLACNPPSGSSFPMGVTTVICIATDGSGNKDTCQFSVTVQDFQPPVVTCPANITLNNTPGRCDAAVNYQPPTGSDNCAGTVNVVCTPPPGSIFPVGTGFVQCVATDATGNKDTCEFTVTINDTQKPSVVCPANMTVTHSSGDCSNTVNYTPPTGSDNCAGAVSVVCTPPSGSVFPFGTTTVTCVATDGAGSQESCSFTVSVTNQPPTVILRDSSVINCPGFEVCLQVSASDPDPGDIITVEKVSGPGTFTPVTGPTPVSTQFCFTPSANGILQFVFKVTNSCGAIDYDTASINVLCLPPPPPTGPCLSLQIDTVSAFLGSDVEVSITNPLQFVDSGVVPNPSGIGGFSFLISYDCACLQFLSARKGAMLVAQGWEFFTYRYGAIGNGNCGSGCPSCLLRIVAIADVNNGAAHPNLSRNNAGEWVVLKFRVSSDRTLNGMCCPINWYWFDCTDNTISDSTGNVTWVAEALYSADGTPIDLATAFPVDVSNCDQFSGGPGKPSPRKRCCLQNGRICIPFDTDIDDRGDLNLNGSAYDVGDAVLFENYFIHGSGVLSSNPTQRQAQIAASDVNGDGISLSVGDLVALIRVLTGDAPPLPNKLVPIASGVSLNWSLSGKELKITTTSASELGGLFVHFKYSGTAEKTLQLLPAADGMAPKVNVESGELRVLIDSDRKGARLPAGEVSFVLPLEGAVELVEAQASNYYGQPLPVTVKAAALPTQFALSQNYPNPFNPKTNFTLSMPTTGHYKITLYNLLGEAVRVFEGEAPAGHQIFTWDGTDGRGRPVSSGMYLYKAEVDKQIIIKKMVLMR